MATAKKTAANAKSTEAESKVVEQSTSTAVAVAAPKSVAVAAPDFLSAEDMGVGFEGAGQDAYAIPFLQILQKMSPIVDEDNPKHIKGAKAGMIYNTVTGKLYDVKESTDPDSKSVPLVIVQAAYKHSFIRWGSRDGDQGGFKGEITPEEMDAIIASGAVENQDGKLFVKNADGTFDPKKSDYYADTRSHFVVAVDQETGEAMNAILSLASTQIKSSKTLMTSLQNKKVSIGGRIGTPATYANKVLLTTTVQSNEKGTWSTAKFTLDGLVSDPEIFAQAKAFHKAITSGAAKADYTKSVDTGEGAVGGTPKTAEGF
jgi:hypothetical protein